MFAISVQERASCV